MQQKLNWHDDLFTNGENLHGKNLTRWLRSPLPRIHYYQNKWLEVKESQYFIPTYSWTLTLIPNWTCSVVTISPFQCMAPSTWLTNCADPSTWLQSPTWEGCWLQNSYVHHSIKIMKLLDLKTLWCMLGFKFVMLANHDKTWQKLSLISLEWSTLKPKTKKLKFGIKTIELQAGWFDQSKDRLDRSKIAYQQNQRT